MSEDEETKKIMDAIESYKSAKAQKPFPFPWRWVWVVLAIIAINFIGSYLAGN